MNWLKHKFYFQPDAGHHPCHVLVYHKMKVYDIYIPTADGQLHGWLIPARQERYANYGDGALSVRTDTTFSNVVGKQKGIRLVLFCHGNSGNIAVLQEFIHDFQQYLPSIALCVFDYSTFGQSMSRTGRLDEQICYRDASCIMDHLLEMYLPQEIGIWGFSLGGPIASYVAQHYQLPCLILHSTFPCMQDVAEHFVPWWLRGIAKRTCRKDFNTLASLQNYSGDVLILHSTRDDVIPYHLATKLIDGAILAHSVRLHKIHGLHVELQIPWTEISSFLKNFSR